MALFTHSYYSGTGAEVNPAAAYISDAMICKGPGKRSPGLFVARTYARI